MSPYIRISHSVKNIRSGYCVIYGRYVKECQVSECLGTDTEPPPSSCREPKGRDTVIKFGEFVALEIRYAWHINCLLWTWQSCLNRGQVAVPTNGCSTSEHISECPQNFGGDWFPNAREGRERTTTSFEVWCYGCSGVKHYVNVCAGCLRTDIVLKRGWNISRDEN
jgi:hypothetical protein